MKRIAVSAFNGCVELAGNHVEKTPRSEVVSFRFLLTFCYTINIKISFCLFRGTAPKLHTSPNLLNVLTRVYFRNSITLT